jgi:NtrC-family two-component system response regulator AlgB
MCALEEPVSTEIDRALRVLAIDDDRRILDVLREGLLGDGHRVETTTDADEARAAAERGVFDVAFLDQRLGSASGLDLIPALLERAPRLKIIVITAFASIEDAVEAMKRGASDYLPKPFSLAQMRLTLKKAARLDALEGEVETLREDLERSRPPVRLESESSTMRKTLATLRQVAEGSDATVLLRGESGTGKGVLARAVHDWSARSGRPFVTVHAPSFPAELFESELFGHKKGAFTGATQTNEGRVAQAEGGTLFLDEIGDLPLALQPKLLRFLQVLQKRAYERVGDPQTRHADVRLVAATNQDLEAAVEAGTFRKDLLYRLNVIEATVPPLRERPADVLPTARTFLSFFVRKYNQSVETFTEAARAALRRHHWPGNVRELKNAVERAVILDSGRAVSPEQLPLGSGATSAGDERGETAVRVGAEVSLNTLEAEHIRRVIEATETFEEAAGVLDIDPATLWRHRKKHDLRKRRPTGLRAATRQRTRELQYATRLSAGRLQSRCRAFSRRSRNVGTPLERSMA